MPTDFDADPEPDEFPPTADLSWEDVPDDPDDSENRNDSDQWEDRPAGGWEDAGWDDE